MCTIENFKWKMKIKGEGKMKKKIWYDEIEDHPIRSYSGKKYTEIINTPLVGHKFTIQSIDAKTYLLIIRSETTTGWEVDANELEKYLAHWRRVGFTSLTIDEIVKDARSRLLEC